MWAIPKIIVVVVVLGVVAMAAGILITIVIERQRHHRVLRTHGICTTPQRYRIRRDNAIARHQCYGWVSEAHSKLYNALSMLRLEQRLLRARPRFTNDIFKFATTRENNLSDSSNSTKRSPNRLRKKKSFKTTFGTHFPPCPVIENMDSRPSFLFQGVDAGGLTPQQHAEGVETKQEWSLVSWPLIGVNNIPDFRGDAVPHDCRQPVQVQPERLATKPLPVTMNSYGSLPPTVPLPPLPKLVLTAPSMRRVHCATSQNFADMRDSIPKEQPKYSSWTQSFDEFEFGELCPKPRVKALMHDMKRSLSDPKPPVRCSIAPSDMTGIRNSNPSIKSQFLDSQNLAARSLPNFEPACRHPMLVRTSVDYSGALCPPRAMQNGNSKTLDLSNRPSPINVRRPCSLDTKLYVHAQRNNVFEISGQTKGHRRQNCVRVSLPAIEAKKFRHLRMPRLNEESVEGSNLSSTTNRLFDMARDDAVPFPILEPSNGRTTSLKRLNTPHTLHDHSSKAFMHNQGLCDLEENSPAHQRPSILRSDSPTLPCAVYIPTVPYPRGAGVHGRRDPHPCSLATKQKYSQEELENFQPISRDTSVEEEDHNGSHVNGYHINKFGHESERQTLTIDAQLEKAVPSQSLTSAWTSTPTNEIAHSQSTVSIWEDVSIDGDPPEPELSKAFGHGTYSLVSPLLISSKNIVDVEARENMTRDQQERDLDYVV